MSTCTTHLWCGFEDIIQRSELVRETFDKEFDVYIQKYFKHFSNFFKTYSCDQVLDLMVVLVNDVDVNICAYFKLLVVSYVLVTKFGHLSFSSLENKNYFLNEITNIRRKIYDHIQGIIAKECLISVGLFVGALYVAYKTFV